jgi:uncharacterized membrane protein
MLNAPMLAALWLHSLATVVVIGHYLLLSLVYLPYLGEAAGATGIAKPLGAVSARTRPLLLASLLVLAGTGGYLTVADPNYLGLGSFGNFWSVLMLAKHLLIGALLVLAGAFEVSVRRALTGALPGWTKLVVDGQAALGAAVLLLTAAAQAA